MAKIGAPPSELTTPELETVIRCLRASADTTHPARLWGDYLAECEAELERRDGEPGFETQEERAFRLSCAARRVHWTGAFQVRLDLRRLLRELRDEVDRVPTPSAMMAGELAAAEMLRRRLQKALEGHRDAMDVARDEELPASGIKPRGY